MNPVVMKFGGSSLADADGIRRAAALVHAAIDRAPLVVVSAIGSTTDELFAAVNDRSKQVAIAARHRDIVRRLFESRDRGDVEREIDLRLASLDRALEAARRASGAARELDAVVAHGELLSSAIFAAFSHAMPFDARDVLATDGTHGAARPDAAAIARAARERLAPHVRAGRAIVTQGYIGRAPDGATTTLGRGGSATSAAWFAGALGARDLEIWTDVAGIFDADPRAAGADRSARPIPLLSFVEAARRAWSGARMLHPAMFAPLQGAGVTITIRDTRNPHGRCTRITESGDPPAD